MPAVCWHRLTIVRLIDKSVVLGGLLLTLHWKALLCQSQCHEPLCELRLEPFLANASVHYLVIWLGSALVKQDKM